MYIVIYIYIWHRLIKSRHSHGPRQKTPRQSDRAWSTSYDDMETSKILPIPVNLVFLWVLSGKLGHLLTIVAASMLSITRAPDVHLRR